MIRFHSCICSASSTSPSRQSTARSPNTYRLPSLAIEPSSTAVLATRWQTSRALAAVRAPPVGRPISVSVCWIRSKEETEKRGLFELHYDALLQRGVEHWVAGRVGEVGENDSVSFSQGVLALGHKPECDR